MVIGSESVEGVSKKSCGVEFSKEQGICAQKSPFRWHSIAETQNL